MKRSTMLTLGLLVALLATPAMGQNLQTYRVTITNLTYSQIIGPPVVATHAIQNLFAVGKPASPEVAAIAEDADASGMLAALEADDRVLDFAIADGPLLPGASVTFELQAGGRYGRLSALGMLVTTNDAFFGLNNFSINGEPRFKTVDVPAYDAGSEANTESCDDIPGPPCGNPFVRVTAGAEGFVHVHRGIQGGGDLDPVALDWRNPSARITVERVE